MVRQIIILVGVLMGLLIIGGGGLFAYNYMATDAPPVSFVPKESLDSQPDNSVLAGLVQQVSANSITITKQNGTSVTLGIATTTRVYITSQSSTVPQAASVSGLTVGHSVLITPAVNQATVAESIVIVSAPPTL